VVIWWENFCVSSRGAVLPNMQITSLVLRGWLPRRVCFWFTKVVLRQGTRMWCCCCCLKSRLLHILHFCSFLFYDLSRLVGPKETHLACKYHASHFHKFRLSKDLDKPVIILNKSSAVAEMGDHGDNRDGPKRGGWWCAPFTGGAGSLSNIMWPGQRSTSIPSGVIMHPAVWHNRHQPKTGGCAPFSGGGGGAATSSITTSPGSRFTSVASGVLIHPAVWPQ